MFRQWQASLLAMGTLACLAAVPLGIGFAILSPLAFYAQSNTMSPAVWTAFLLALGLWVVCILGPFAAWAFFRRGHSGRAWTAMALPVAWGAALAVAWRLVYS